MNWIFGVSSKKALVKEDRRQMQELVCCRKSEDATNLSTFSGHVELQSRASLGALALVYRT
jgi:hypothetical protein